MKASEKRNMFEKFMSVNPKSSSDRNQDLMVFKDNFVHQISGAGAG